MLRLDAENFSICQGPATGREQNSVMIAVEGTHSAGKTTVLHDYVAAKELLSFDDIDDFGTHHEFAFPQAEVVAEIDGIPMLKPSYNCVCVKEDINGIAVPVVISAESARLYDAMRPWDHALTTGYSHDGQASITLRCMSAAQRAAMSAAAVARVLQPDRERTVSAAITDRGVLSGFVYARLRLPDENHDLADVAKISDIPTTSHVINIGRQARSFVDVYDKVLLTDYTEVAFDDDGKRVADPSFRNHVASGIEHAYRKHLPAGHIDILRGDRLARKQQLRAHLRSLLAAQLTA